MHHPFPSRLLYALFLLLHLIPASALAQPDSTGAPDPTRFLRWAFHDARHLVQEMDAEAAAYTTGAAALLLPATSFDEAINPQVQDLYGGAFRAYLEFANAIGGPRASLPVAGIFAASLFTDNVRLQDAAFTSLQALAYAGTISYAIKYTIGRLRPDEAAGALRIAPFSGHTSFPSGHATAAFAIVTPWVFYYPRPWTYGLFAVSTGTALARLARNKHWATDVLAGSALGFVTAYWLSRQHQNQSSLITVRPAISPQSMTLSLRVSL